MRLTLALTSLMPLLLLATPAAAATSAQKMETCKAGAEHDSLAGAKRDAFIKKCMTNANYEPAARKDALKKKPAGAKPAAAAAPAAAEPEE
ncbi:MAG: PsiF family protein [Pseudolabrys sp.]|nr:PsiF family protein [Pseudolabrys sp.]